MPKYDDKLGLDPNHYEHVSTDDKKVILRHKKGSHEIHIARNSLSKKLQGHLDKLAEVTKTESQKDEKDQYGKVEMKAEGGSVERVDKKKAADMSQGAMSGGPTLAQGVDNVKKALGFADGGQIPELLKRQQPTELEQAVSPISLEQSRQEDLSNKLQAKEEQIRQDSALQSAFKKETAPVKSASDIKSEAINQMVGEKEQQDANLKAQQDAKLAAASAEQSKIDQQQKGLSKLGLPNTAPTAAEQAPNMETAAAPLPSTPVAQLPAEQPNLLGQYQASLAGQTRLLGEMGELQKSSSDEQAKALQHNDRAIAKLQSEENGVRDEIRATSENLEHDIKNNLVDPDKFWTGYKDAKGNMVGGHSKIGAAIGMILAGFRIGDGPNAAVDFLNKEIDRNLQAQSQNINTRQNLLRANLEKYRDLNSAISASKLTLQNDTLRRLEIAKTRAQGPLAQKELELKAEQLKMQMIPEMRKFEDGLIVQRLSQKSDPESLAALDKKMSDLAVTNPEMRKQLEPRYIPGVGMASKDVPQVAHDGIVAAIEFNNTMKKYEAFAKAHEGTVLDRGIVNEGKGLAAKAQELYRKASEGGVFKAGEQDFIESIIPSDPTQFFAKMRTLSKIKPIMESNNHQLNTVMKSYGFKTPQSLEQQAAPTSQSKPGQILINDKTGQKLQLINNKWTPI